MIYWFSATGNSEHMAMRLAELLHEETAEITQNTEIGKNSRMIFVIPLYFWTLPIIVRNLFERTSWAADEEVVVIFTCGGFIGTADRDVKKLVHPANVLVYQLPMESKEKQSCFIRLTNVFHASSVKSIARIRQSA